jgi:hypothetical protein
MTIFLHAHKYIDISSFISDQLRGNGRKGIPYARNQNPNSPLHWRISEIVEARVARPS